MIPDGKSLTHKNKKPDSNNTLSKSRADKGCLRVPVIPRARRRVVLLQMSSEGRSPNQQQRSGHTHTPHAPATPRQGQLTGKDRGGSRRAGAQGEEGFRTLGWA